MKVSMAVVHCTVLALYFFLVQSNWNFKMSLMWAKVGKLAFIRLQLGSQDSTIIRNVSYEYPWIKGRHCRINYINLELTSLHSRTKYHLEMKNLVAIGVGADNISVTIDVNSFPLPEYVINVQIKNYGINYAFLSFLKPVLFDINK